MWIKLDSRIINMTGVDDIIFNEYKRGKYSICFIRYVRSLGGYNPIELFSIDYDSMETRRHYFDALCDVLSAQVWKKKQWEERKKEIIEIVERELL